MKRTVSGLGISGSPPSNVKQPGSGLHSHKCESTVLKQEGGMMLPPDLEETLPQKDVLAPISISLLNILYISIKTCYIFTNDHAMSSHPDRWGLQLCLRCSHLSETWTWSGHRLQPNKSPTVLQLDCSPALPLSS